MEKRHAHLARRILVIAASAAVLGSPALLQAAAISANLSVVKTRSTSNPAHPGEVIGYRFTVANAGIDDASNVVLTDVLPGNTTFDEGGGPAGWNCTAPNPGDPGTFQCTIATLSSGATATDFYLEVRVPNANVTPIVNTATVSSDTPDPDTSDNSSSVSTDVAALPSPSVPTLSGGFLTALAAVVGVAGLFLLRR